MPITTLQQTKTMKQKTTTRRRIASAFALLFMVGIFAQIPVVKADRFDAQINQLQNQNNQSNAAKQQLQAVELDLSAQVNQLQAEINALQAQIAESQAQKAATEQQISENQAKLDVLKNQLSETLRALYIDNGITEIEMLATSDSLSAFVDKAEYRTAVQNKLVETTTEIKQLQAKLGEQKLAIERNLADQTRMNTEANGKRAETGRLLSLNQQQQSDYNNAVNANNSKIADLRRQQAIENARYNVGSARKGGTGGYPWAGVSYPSYSADPWGMYKRECVSYTAWKVSNSGRYMPYWGGRGNAKLWDDNARNAGIPVDTNPRPGDVAISNSGTYGHAMYVEAVHDDGTITVSQYNASWDGDYSIAKRSVGNLVFIHF